jgi:solute:Na+ symporter, SSS family
MLGLFLLGVFSQSKNTVGAVIAVIAGVLVILWLTVSPMVFEETAASQFHSYLTIVFGTVLIFFTGFFFLLLKIS